ncbi:hypothetical protein N7478_007025 [Penicillium angulare]|uniref:uncharacterized protein n=1 Tax=Penicillium angulare TaxID=116970 RepID=UPI00253FF20A|nr:uncharacterized protein N7478_007025 [Penicillium angulare]KAJ5281653.1 hypothetical protein N7478_007025 [Penicillium angulare]
MVALGIENPGAVVHPLVETNLVTGFMSAANIAFSYVSHNTFFTFMAELENPRDFPKALALLQTVDMTLYIIASVVIYRYAGASVEPPALGSASPLIVTAGVINSHVAAKSIKIHAFAGTDRMHKRDWVAVSSWVGIAVAPWIIAWIIAMAIPNFSSMLTLITALFGSWFTFIFTFIFGFHLNQIMWFSSPRKILLTFLNTLAICVGLILCGLGLYSAGKSTYDNPSSSSFSCANNS